MEDVNFNEILNYFKSKIVFILIMILFVVVLGMFYSLYIKVPLYQSTSTIVLARPETETQSLQSDLTLNQSLVDTYKEIVKSRSVLEKSIEQLDLNMKYETLLNNVSVDNVTNTEVIKITVISENSEEATELVTTITEVFSEEVTDIWDIQNIKVLDTASTEEEPFNINMYKEIIIYIGIGMALSFITLLIRYSLDTTIKNVAEVELVTGLPILGAVPIFEEKRGIYE